MYTPRGELKTGRIDAVVVYRCVRVILDSIKIPRLLLRSVKARASKVTSASALMGP